MKIYGLFRIINYNSYETHVADFYNLLHPDKKIMNVAKMDVEPRTFFHFFFENDPIMIKKDVDIQYLEYNRIKRELDQLTSRVNKSEFDRENIAKRIAQIATAENKFIKHRQRVEELELAANVNLQNISEIEKTQSKYAKNFEKYLKLYYNYVDIDPGLSSIPDDLKVLFDTQNVPPELYEETIMFPKDIVSFCRTGIKHMSEKQLQIDKDRMEYVVFELDKNEDVKIRIEDDDKISKLTTLIKLCEELNIPVPEQATLKLKNNQINYITNGNKKLAIFVVDKTKDTLEYDIVKPDTVV